MLTWDVSLSFGAELMTSNSLIFISSTFKKSTRDNNAVFPVFPSSAPDNHKMNLRDCGTIDARGTNQKQTFTCYAYLFSPS